MSKFERICAIFLLVCGIILVGGFGFKFGDKRGYSRGYSDGYSAYHNPDTVWKADTEYIDKPVPYEVKPSGVEMWPIGTLAQLKAKLDSLSAVTPDTAYVEIPVPIETKLYQDSTYRAQVSGWHPSLDWLEVYQKTAYITNYVDRPVEYKESMSAFGEAGASFSQRYARAGLRYDGTIYGPIKYTLKAGYEWSSLGKGGFMEGGVSVVLWKK